MNNDNIKVYTNKRHTGNLVYEEAKYVFNYIQDAKDVVSLTMPIRNASWDSKKLHPIFQMNLPEGALKDAIKNHFAKIQTMDDLNLLRLIGPYMLGRVKFDKIIECDDKISLDEILNSSKQNLFDELMDKFAIRSGISGIQPKLLLQAHNKTTMKFEHYIVKSWESNYPNLGLNEYFCMRAIQNAGLTTPEFYISDDLSMFVMKRFDVKEDNSYFGFEDMCVLTARGTEQKYDGSYEECTRVIKDIIPPQKRKDSLKIFFKAIIMNHLLQNGDGHLKNYGIVYENDFNDSLLAPIYDVITTTLYIKNDIPALKMGDDKLWWSEKTYKAFAKQSCGLSNKEYLEILDECITSIKTTKKEIEDFSIKDDKIKIFLENLVNCWKESL
ncbi:MAG: type II toxin-antitoxin system HipA family toxin [Arcobacteraceae bacterium]|jgi:serine/threonine-protein kinase HipA|nr:type II toxin-antitoxin system HipA family toxin [Arcobacteraceae bacterium]MDY0328213.1 type II toxin-antitoxin system HipA family toxin [Arcobacteraceae bacterium]